MDNAGQAGDGASAEAFSDGNRGGGGGGGGGSVSGGGDFGLGVGFALSPELAQKVYFHFTPYKVTAVTHRYPCLSCQ